MGIIGENMNKEYTGFLKGVAILMMLFLHLFNNAEQDIGLGYIFSIGETPLIYYITNMCNPVPFFLFRVDMDCMQYILKLVA